MSIVDGIVPMVFTGNFRNARKESPVVPENQYSVKVYFMANNLLYCGEYHRSTKQYHANLFYAMPCDPYLMKEKMVCTHWCYVHELKFEKPSLCFIDK